VCSTAACSVHASQLSQHDNCCCAQAWPVYIICTSPRCVLCCCHCVMYMTCATCRNHPH
jgi:hypothetical protein